jgi:hypothetical protein
VLTFKIQAKKDFKSKQRRILNPSKEDFLNSNKWDPKGIQGGFKGDPKH